MKKNRLMIAAASLFVVLFLSSCKDEYTKISFTDLPYESQVFLNTHFPNEVVSHIMKDSEIFDKSYEVFFTDGDNVEFNSTGFWENVDCHNDSVPSSVLGYEISDYINIHHSGSYAVEIDVNMLNYDVELNNGLELVFDSNFDFVRYED